MITRNMLKSVAGVIAPLAVLAAGPASADDVHCPPDLGAVTVDGNVLIAAPCRLDGTIVKGNVHIYAGGSLVARGADIDGNIQAETADFVDVADSRVGGSVQLDDLVGDRSVVTASTVDGSIQLKGNRSRLEIVDNVVGADVQGFSNTGGLLIADNRIDGNLQCKENEPAPVGGNNDVSGNKEDQCADLQPEGTAGGAAAAAAGGSGGASSAVAGSPDDSSGGGGAAWLLALLGGLAFSRRPSRG